MKHKLKPQESQGIQNQLRPVQPYTARQLLRLINKAIRRTSRNAETARILSSHASEISYGFFVHLSFEKVLKKLKKEYRLQEIVFLKQVILDLSVNGFVSGKDTAIQENREYRKIRLGQSDIVLKYGVVLGLKMVMVDLEYDESGEW